MRAETGPMTFGVDWTGTFIRGDDCFWYSSILNRVIAGLEEQYKDKLLSEIPMILLQIAALKELLEKLQLSNEPAPDAQKLKPFEECTQ